MAYLLLKAGKFLEGHSYGTGVGYRFTWTRDELKARRFADGEAADHFRAITGGRFVHRQNNRAESKAIAREIQEHMDRGFKPKTVHDKINARARTQP